MARFLCRAGWTLYASPAYLALRGTLQDLNDLGGHELIGYSHGLTNTPAAQWIEQRARGAPISLRINEVAEMVPAALRGVRLALLPCGLADAEPGLMRRSHGIVASREVSLVYRRVSRRPEPVNAAIALVSEIILQHAKAIEGGELIEVCPERRDSSGGDRRVGRQRWLYHPDGWGRLGAGVDIASWHGRVDLRVAFRQIGDPTARACWPSRGARVGGNRTVSEPAPGGRRLPS